VRVWFLFGSRENVGNEKDVFWLLRRLRRLKFEEKLKKQIDFYDLKSLYKSLIEDSPQGKTF
jgi:hypothetical protein